MIKIKLVISLLLILSFSSLLAQTKAQDSLVLFTFTVKLPVANPPPGYIIEIKNNRTISFYGFMPENTAGVHMSGLNKCSADSTTLLLDSLDFFAFEEVILKSNLKTINDIPKIKNKKNTDGKPVPDVMGGASRNYHIKTSQHEVSFGLGSIFDKDLQEPFLNIRSAIRELEKKYRPL